MKKLLCLLSILVICLFGFSQEEKIKLDQSKKLGVGIKSELFTAECLGVTNSQTADLKWLPILTNKAVGRVPKKGPDHELLAQMKAEKLLIKYPSGNYGGFNPDEADNKTTTPIMGNNWLGNVNNGSSPMDNSLAISNGGIIVSVANNTIEVDNSSGTLLYYDDLATWFNDPLISTVCDPVVIYDKLADRFIVFFQECSSNSSNSYLCIAFSQTNNPGSNAWYKYKITGNPLNNNCWFDYPKMAISNNELYITGNLFNNSGTFNQAVLYQIEKNDGYSGASISWQYWSSIAGSPFTLLPVSNGHGSSYGPGCYLVATSSSGSSNIKLYDLTDYITGSPSLDYYSVSTPAYSAAANANQQGTTCLLDNGDCRALSGFYLNGTIHFVFHSDIGSGWNGINYNRLNVTTLTNQSSTFGSVGNYDYSYPSIVSFTNSSTDKNVMIGFGRSSSSIYPEMRVVNCDNAMNWSASTLIKAGQGYVSYTSSTTERWGDYTGMTRKHNASNRSVWINGMYGTTSNNWNTWIAEIHDNEVTGISDYEKQEASRIYPNPIVESFVIEFDLTENTDLNISVYDMAGNLVVMLYNGQASAGHNLFSFNKGNLSVGSYILNIKSNDKILQSENIVIAN
jgi:hypothetical protein